MGIQPYIDDPAVKQFCREQIEPAYAEAGKPLDANYPVWPCRAVYDHAVGHLSWDASCAKHLRECREVLGLPTPLPPFQVLPLLTIQGHIFHANDRPFTVIQCSDFNLLNRWQHGEEVEPIFTQRATTGFNTLRVWTHYDLEAAKIGRFLDIDYARVPDFLDAAARHGLYVEFTAYTSTEKPDHWDCLKASCRGATNALLELVNEGDLAVNRIDMSRYSRPVDILASRGSAGSQTVPPWEPWDYVGWHTNGASEEQRKIGHNAMEKPADAIGWHGPVLTNETSRYPDVGMWVGASLDRQKQLAYDSAAGAALLCAGSCFHSVHGKSSELWDANELAVAQAWVAGALSVPKCQHEAYRRRDDLLTPDLLRVYQRGTDDANIVRIRV